MISNPSVNELAEELAKQRIPRPGSIMRAMELAYEAGRNDGAIQALNKMIEGITVVGPKK